MKPFTTIAVVFLAAIAVVHLLRLFAGWEVSIAGSSSRDGGASLGWSFRVAWHSWFGVSTHVKRPNHSLNRTARRRRLRAARSRPVSFVR